MKDCIVPKKIKIGTRGSRLALTQTQLFIDELHKAYPDIECEKVVIKTTGDKILDKPLLEFGGKAVFVTEFEAAMRDGVIDCAVHSAKDMPMELMSGMDIVCVLAREDARDVLITRADDKIEQGRKMVIGTGSLRRQGQIKMIYTDVTCVSLRGNVPTRIKKLREGEFDGIILAAAGLKRLGLNNEADLRYEYIDTDKMVPAAGQGIIAVEGRKGDAQEFLQNVGDKSAETELLIERMVLRKLGAGCHEPVGVYSRLINNERIELSVIKECGGQIIKASGEDVIQCSLELADRLIEQLI